MIPIQPGIAPATPRSGTSDDEAALHTVAAELEAGFLEEMLKHAGFGESRGALGGGAGEDQFGSLLRREHARALAQNGGIGLAQALFDTLAAQTAETPEDVG